MSEERRKQLPPYFFTLGRYDFNYFEVLDAARSLPVARLVLFDGSHQWPPPEVAMQAIEWLEAGAREKNVPLPSEEESRARRRQSNAVRQISLQLRAAEDEVEDREQNLADARRDMAALRKKREQASDPEDLAILRRALGQAFAQAYEAGQRLERERKPELAAAFYEVAAEAVPPNPALLYEIASAWAAAGEKQKALDALQRAVALGFRDTARLAADANFDRYRNTQGLQELLGTMQSK
ncbi:MAG: TPR end-of-group domain-containing protein [Terriglobales bacterium]